MQITRLSLWGLPNHDNPQGDGKREHKTQAIGIASHRSHGLGGADRWQSLVRAVNVLRIVVLWATAVLFPLPLMLVYDAIATEPENLKQRVLFGLISYSWWLLAILLSIRPRWLDRRVGLPKVYRLHGFLGLGALVLVYIHEQNSYTSNRFTQTFGEWGLCGGIGTLCLALFFLSSGTP